MWVMKNLVRNRNIAQRAIGVVVALLMGAVFSSQIWAGWLSDAIGINIDVPAGKVEIGTPDPVGAIQRLPQTIQNLPQDTANLGNPAGLALAFAVRQAKTQAAFGARAMPADVYQQLLPYFSAGFLQSVQYNTFDNARITLDAAVMMLNNDVTAITLEDIVVFRNEGAAHNAVTWAHELTHVGQYRSRGIDTFANTYTTNAWILENEAKDVEARIAQSLAPNVRATGEFGYFLVAGWYLYGDSYGLLYPADPQTGIVTGPANGRVFVQNGQYVAQDSFGGMFAATRVR